MRSLHKLLVAAVSAASFVVLTSDALAQTHFSSCAQNTGSSALAVITADSGPVLDGSPLSHDSEIAVFSQDGYCMGVVVWEGANTTIAIWGDNLITPAKDGAQSGDVLNFRVWDAEQQVEVGETTGQTTLTLSSSEPYFRPENTFEEGAIYRLASLVAHTASEPEPEPDPDPQPKPDPEPEPEPEPKPALSAPALAWPVAGAIDVTITPALEWSDAEADSYELHVATDAEFSNRIVEETDLAGDSFLLPDLEPSTTYYWRVRASSDGSTSTWSPAQSFQTAAATATSSDPRETIPGETRLLPNYPNPASGSTRIPFELAESGRVEISVYDVLGRRIANLASDVFTTGRQEVSWDVSRLPSGTYFCRLVVDGVVKTQPIRVLR